MIGVIVLRLGFSYTLLSSDLKKSIDMLLVKYASTFIRIKNSSPQGLPKDGSSPL